jgi:transposase InsO family protein
VLEVTPSCYYQWRKGIKSARQQRDEALLVQIQEIHQETDRTYGSPRIHVELQARGEQCGEKRVLRLMRSDGLQGCKALTRKWRGSKPDKREPVAANELDRDFVATSPDEKWVVDFTYVWTWQGWLYVAVVLDLYGRRVVGLATGTRHTQDLVVNALSQALQRRCRPSGFLHHSDRGSEYGSDDYVKLLRECQAELSMSRVGNCWDNAVVESFFATMKTELIYRRSFATRAEARTTIFEWIEVFYNRKRRHSANNYLSPVDYENQYHQLRRAA